MRFKLDAHLSAGLVELFEQRGHDAATAYEQKLGSADDPELWLVSSREGRTLVTMDVGIGNLRHYRVARTPGIVELRGRSTRFTEQQRLVLRLLEEIESGTTSPAGELWIVEHWRLRKRADL